jgi:hypothetical protein
MSNLWFDRMDNNDRSAMSRKIKEHIQVRYTVDALLLYGRWRRVWVLCSAILNLSLYRGIRLYLMISSVDQLQQDAAKPPLLLFPEGTCVNNEYAVMFKRGAFEMDATIIPVGMIRYSALRNY